MVGRFLQVIIAKVKNAGGSILFTMEEGMHDEKVVITIEHLMDAVIHIKKDAGNILVKAECLKGFEDWMPFHP
jgi:hypothetical protein